MLAKSEYDKYRGIVESEETKETMLGQSPELVARLGSEVGVYYARLSGELADIKDEIDTRCYELMNEGMKVSQADRVAEVQVNEKHEVTRRQISNLMQALDKLSFACLSRIKSFEKEWKN